MLLDFGKKPEGPVSCQADTGRAYKLHTEKSQNRNQTYNHLDCEAAALNTADDVKPVQLRIKQ